MSFELRKSQNRWKIGGSRKAPWCAKFVLPPAMGSRGAQAGLFQSLAPLAQGLRRGLPECQPPLARVYFRPRNPTDTVGTLDQKVVDS
jgi:hypothetical protein